MENAAKRNKSLPKVYRKIMMAKEAEAKENKVGSKLESPYEY